MASRSSKSHAAHDNSGVGLADLARAYGGAILFSFPILMTMEMWWLGFSIEKSRLVIFTLAAIPLLIGLSHYDGFEDTFTGMDDVRETFIAYFVGFTSSGLMLFLFGVLGHEHSFDEILGKISIQAVPASLGAMFAQSLIGGKDLGDQEQNSAKRKRSASYWGQLFLTVVGAIFLSMSVAPTEEMTLISYQMNNWHTLALIAVTLFAMHAFIGAAEARGRQIGVAARTTFTSLFVRYTVVGYAAVMLVSYYILWTFGSIDGMGFSEQLRGAVVLAFPAGIGGAASRMIL